MTIKYDRISSDAWERAAAFHANQSTDLDTGDALRPHECQDRRVDYFDRPAADTAVPAVSRINRKDLR